jgi:superfamily II DNA/RNA helicase
MTEFSDLGLSALTLQAVADTGYTTATPIQAQAIPVALAGRDVLGIAQTGTGKTAAFTLPMIERLAAGRSKARMPRSLVIAPTRELADQVAASFEKYAKGRKLTWALLIGGVSFNDQEAKLDRGVDVLIATPGRLLDHFERGKLLLTGVQILVVDEADRMLDMGFIPDIERIFKLTPPKKQVFFFSATMPPEITRLTKQFLNDAVRIEAARPATTAETITQNLVRIPSAEPKAKRMALRALIERADVKNGIVFCNRKSEVDIVAKSLKVHGLDAAPIHGDLDQSTRMKTLAAFRSGELRLLVASDVAARGLDIPDVSHVFNYDVPHHADDYVHRIGRTGRAGKLGQTFMIVTPADSRNLDKVLKLIGQNPVEITVDLDWSLAKDDRPKDVKDRERGRGRPSSRDRDRDRERPRKDHGERASMAPAEAVEAAPVEAAPVIAQAELPVVDEAVAAEPQAERTERPRRSRGGRGRGRREEAPADAAPAAEAVEAAPEPREAREPREPREAREPRERREERPRRDERPVRGVSTPQPRDDDDRRVVGFGNDVPAFLTRATPKVPDASADE